MIKEIEIGLREKIERLNQMKIIAVAKLLIPFCGVLSEYLPAMSLGIPEENITGIEINERYCKIGEARKKYWTKNDFYFKLDKKEFTKKKQELEKKKIKEDKKYKKKKLF